MATATEHQRDAGLAVALAAAAASAVSPSASYASTMRAVRSSSRLAK
jgi:hypothetical protein